MLNKFTILIFRALSIGAIFVSGYIIIEPLEIISYEFSYFPENLPGTVQFFAFRLLAGFFLLTLAALMWTKVPEKLNSL